MQPSEPGLVSADWRSALVDSRLAALGLEPLVLYGSLKPAERAAVHERLTEDRQLLLVATDRYIGEGFVEFPWPAPGELVRYL